MSSVHQNMLHKVEVQKHVFNNNKFCRFEEIGCMFKHAVAPIYHNQSNCIVNLCQYRHSFASNICEKTTKSNSDLDYPPSNNQTVGENTGNEMSDLYTCNECEFVSKFVAGLRIHASSKHKKKDILN